MMAFMFPRPAASQRRSTRLSRAAVRSVPSQTYGRHRHRGDIARTGVMMAALHIGLLGLTVTHLPLAQAQHADVALTLWQPESELSHTVRGVYAVNSPTAHIEASDAIRDYGRFSVYLTTLRAMMTMYMYNSY